jgi:hypothetical protein
MKAKVIIGIVILIGVLAVISAVSNWYGGQHQPAVSQCEYIKQPEPKIITKIKRVEVPGPERIVTIEKQVVVEKLKLPDWVKNDANKQVIAVVEIAPYEGKTNAAAIMDTKTGTSEIIAKQVPLSLFGLENKKELGIRAGYTTDEWKTRSTVYGRWDFLRVGNAHLGFYGEANSRGEGIAQIEINYRF